MSGEGAMGTCAPLWNYPAFDHEELLREHGSPLFLFFPGILQRNVHSLGGAFRSRYPNHVIAYSVKTNHLPCVVQRAVACGAVPEIVAGLELDLVERLGLIDGRTVVNGPFKTESELRRLVSYRCRLNVENVTELEVLERIGAETDTDVKIGLRVSWETGNVPWKRFGFRLGAVLEMARHIKAEMPHLRVVGLHVHGGTNITDTAYYREAALSLCDLARQMEHSGLPELAYLDLGGGFATSCPFKDSAEWYTPSAAEYADAVVGPIVDTFGTAGPTLIVEPGRYLIDDAFLLLTTVERFREHGRHEVIVDAGINVLPSARFRRHRIACLTRSTSACEEFTIFGPLCMQSDCLGEGVALPSLRCGDVLAIDHAGAYSISQAWNFIQLLPAVVAIEDGKSVLVRRRQTIDDFLGRDVL